MGPAPAHPRVCGENGEHCAYPVEHPGSSPRVRGKLLESEGEGYDGRLIPARAGKTQLLSSHYVKVSAHPRACGENEYDQCTSAKDVWLIPARAGKTSRPQCRLWLTSAHPRACGENSAPDMQEEPGNGSSPRVRGKPERAALGTGLNRLIPARAGKTGANSLGRGGGSAHPRACGENTS